MNISLVQPEYLDVVWPKVSEFIKRSVDYSYGRWSVEDVYRFISEGKMILWIAHDNNSIVAASVTIVSEYPSKKFLGIQFLVVLNGFQSNGMVNFPTIRIQV